MSTLRGHALSIDLVTIASQAGREARHVAHLGKAGWKDWNVARTASHGDCILVTNNAGDVRKISAKAAIHAGLVIIIANVTRAIHSSFLAARSTNSPRPPGRSIACSKSISTARM